MASLRASVLIGAVLFASAARADNTATKNLTLIVGDSQVVHFPLGTDLTVSRRGVVDLFHAGNGNWEITALRGGFAVIDGKDAVTGDSRPPRVFVTVLAADDRHALIAPPDLPDWICKAKGVRCQRDAGIVQGQVDEPLWWQRAQDFCRKNEACLFAVELSEQGRLKQQTRYRLAAKIFLIEDGAAQELGFDDDTKVTVDAVRGKSDFALLSRLRAMARDHKAEIISEPLFRLTPGQETQLINGGEFQVVERESDGNGSHDVTSWKQHGLVLKILLTPLGKGRARLTYDLSLKSPTENHAALSVNSLKSEVELPLGTPVLVGVLDLEARLGETHETPPLASIPLIGPLFRGSGNQASKSRLGFWLHLEEDTDNPLSGPWSRSGPPAPQEVR